MEEIRNTKDYVVGQWYIRDDFNDCVSRFPSGFSAAFRFEKMSNTKDNSFVYNESIIYSRNGCSLVKSKGGLFSSCATFGKYPITLEEIKKKFGITIENFTNYPIF